MYRKSGSNKPKDNKVIPDPIDDRKFQEWKESGKSGILLGITLNPRKCIGEKVRRIPINVETKWWREFLEEDEVIANFSSGHNLFLFQ